MDIRLAVDIHTTHSTPSVGTIQVGLMKWVAVVHCSSVILSKSDIILANYLVEIRVT